MYPWTAFFLLFTLWSAIVGNCQDGGGTDNTNNRGGGRKNNDGGGGADPRSFSLCPSVDNLGIALSAAAWNVTSGLLECDYSGTQCTYLISDGALSSTLSTSGFLTCAATLPDFGPAPGIVTDTPTPTILTGTKTLPVGAITSSASNVETSSRVTASASDLTSTATGNSATSPPLAGTTTARVTASASSLTSTGTGNSATSPPLAGSTTASTRLPTKAIGVIVFTVMIVMFMSFSGAIFFLRRRRLHRRATERDATQTRRQTGTISPFTLITQIDSPNEMNTGIAAEYDARSIGENTMARQQLETELLAVQEKMVGLGDEERRTTMEGSSVHTMSRPASMPATSGNAEAQLKAAREQINRLMLRVNALEANTDPAWELAMSREPPPEYV
ncbi:hypothetical protein B0H19DRAFT_1067632 [Mycena capillaripes]|nr:hypothetical protein B0H19DRAFT_1067632 [Mycena capillaripes]